MKILWNRTKNTKKRENVFSIFSSRMVFPEFFFSKNAFGPHFPPTSSPGCFSHFLLYFHDFLPFSKVLELRSRGLKPKNDFFRFHNGWDYQTHHFQQLSGWKQSPNREILEFTRIRVRFSGKIGRIHGTGVPLNHWRVVWKRKKTEIVNLNQHCGSWEIHQLIRGKCKRGRIYCRYFKLRMKLFNNLVEFFRVDRTGFGGWILVYGRPLGP